MSGDRVRGQLLAMAVIAGLALTGCSPAADSSLLPEPLTVGPADGRWTELGVSSDIAPLVIDGDEWLIDIYVDPRASTTCGPVSGAWLALGEGRVSTTSPQIGVLEECPHFTLSSWIEHTHFAGFDGNLLVLLDEGGNELGRLAPVPLSAASLSPEPPPPAASVEAELLGTWTITDAATSETGTITFTSPRSFTAQLPCGETDGVWITAGNAWLAETGLVGPDCVRDGQLAIPWITQTVGIEPTADGWTLTGIDGASTATLADFTPAETSMEDSYRAQPLDPAFTVDRIEGRWLVVSADESANPLDAEGKPIYRTDVDTYLELARSAWTVSEGCSGGRFAELGDGFVVSIAPAIVGGIACDGLQIAPLVASMRTAGFDGDELVLFDASGDELLRLARG